MLKDVVADTEPGQGFLYGIRIHATLAARLRALDLPGIGRHGIAQSFVAGDIVRHGLSGSIRTDVLLRPVIEIHWLRGISVRGRVSIAVTVGVGVA